MALFSIIPEGQAILQSRGVYRQVPVYERAGLIYAKFGGGFVRLVKGGGTSHINIKWSEIDLPIGTHRDTRETFIQYIPAPDDVARLEAAE